MKANVWKDSYGFFRIGWLVAFWLAVVAALIVGLILAITQAERVSCERSAHAMDRDHTFGVFEGCLIETDGGTRVPLDNFRTTNEEER